MNVDNMFAHHTPTPAFTAAFPMTANPFGWQHFQNVYLDSSEFITLVFLGEYSHVLTLWFETFSEKVLFGSDAFPYSGEVNVYRDLLAGGPHGSHGACAWIDITRNITQTASSAVCLFTIASVFESAPQQM